MGFPMYFTLYGGEQPRRIGASHAAIAPYGPFTFGDGKAVFLGIENEREWARFCEVVLGRPEATTDPQLNSNSNSNSKRVANAEKLRATIEGVFGRMAVAKILELLDEAQIANARMKTVREFVDHPRLEARDRWREVGSPVGPLLALLPPVSLGGYEAPMNPVPDVGEHTEALLKDLGFQPEVVTDLRPSGKI